MACNLLYLQGDLKNNSYLLGAKLEFLTVSKALISLWFHDFINVLTEGHLDWEWEGGGDSGEER